MSDFDPMLFSRRIFLSRGVQLISAASTLPLFLDRSAMVMAQQHADNPQGAGRPDHRVLVVLQLAGGNDGLNTIIPVRQDDYYKARPRLAIPRATALELNKEFSTHPSAVGLKKLFDAGRLSVIQAVGYPNPNRSHFRSTDIWASAQPDRNATDGWLGRYFDNACAGADPGKPGEPTPPHGIDPRSAISLTNEPPLTLAGRKFAPMAFRSLSGLTYTRYQRESGMQGAFEQMNDLDQPETESPMDEDHNPTMQAPPPRMPMGSKGSVESDPNDATSYLQRSALNARLYADEIRQKVNAVKNKATYPGSRLAQDLRLVAQMIAGGLPTRVYYVTLGGFDTHANQLNRHAQLTAELFDALNAFIEDLAALGVLDRTLVMTFSEFGRRVAENVSAGTDHGEAAPMFLAGANVKPGFFGEMPSLAPRNLSRGDVPWKIDFRRVYAEILRDWLKADDRAVLGQRFAPLKLLKA